MHGRNLGGNPCHVTLGLDLGYRFVIRVRWATQRTILLDSGFVGDGRATPRDTGYAIPGVCLTVTILQDQRRWRR